MPRPDISDNERIVLYNLTKHPLLNDRELSEHIKMKISTITSIKNRLMDARLLSTVRALDASRLGYEVVWVRYGTYSSSSDPTEVLRREREFCKSFDIKTYFYAQAGHTVCSWSLAHDITEAQRALLAIEKDLAGRKVSRDIQNMFFSLQASRVLRDFDCSFALSKQLGIREISHVPQLDAPPQTPPKDMRRSDVRLLLALVEAPDATDTIIAESIGTTRQAVSRLRKRLEIGGMLRTVRMPSLQRLGLDILVFTRYAYKMNLDKRARIEIAGATLSALPVFHMVYSPGQSATLAAYPDYDSYQAAMEAVDSHFYEKGFLEERPQSLLLSVPDQVFAQDLDFSQIVRGMVRKRD
jgi:DNA-binding MarR family transcriptional regulator